MVNKIKTKRNRMKGRMSAEKKNYRRELNDCVWTICDWAKEEHKKKRETVYKVCNKGTMKLGMRECV